MEQPRRLTYVIVQKCEMEPGAGLLDPFFVNLCLWLVLGISWNRSGEKAILHKDPVRHAEDRKNRVGQGSNAAKDTLIFSMEPTSSFA